MEDIKNILQENLAYYLEQKKIIVSRLSVLPRGKVKEKKINGDTYFYLQSRQAGRVVDEYIGKTVPQDLQEAHRVLPLKSPLITLLQSHLP